MKFDRAHRLNGDSHRPTGEVDAESNELRVPGRGTLVELLEQSASLSRSAPATMVPGRRTLIDDAAPARLGFEDYRVLGLRDVLQRLGPDHPLRPDVLAAADRTVSRRATPPWAPAPSGAAAPAGHALWHAAERHAVTLYRRAVDAGQVDERDPAIAAALDHRGSGQSLPADVRRTMEAQLGAPLDRVRIHTDRVAAEAARAVHAEAFTVGEDIFFADGAFAPDSRDGQRLLAHELTHVMQAWQGRTGNAGRISQPGDALEHEAESVADRVGRGEPATRSVGPGGEPAARNAGPGAEPAARNAQPAATPAPVPTPAQGQPLLRKAASGARGAGQHIPETKGGAKPTPPKAAQAMTAAGGAFAARAQTATAQAAAKMKPGLADAHANPPGKKAHEHARADRKTHKAAEVAARAAEQAHLDAAGAHASEKPEAAEAPVARQAVAAGHGPIRLKSIDDWSRFMPAPLPDQDERERKRIEGLVKHKIEGDRSQASQAFDKLRTAHIAQAGAVRASTPRLQAQIAASQQQALGHVASSERSQAAAVQGHVAGVQGQVSGHAAAQKAQVTGAYTAAIAKINATYDAADKLLTEQKTNAAGSVDISEMFAVITLGFDFVALKGEFAKLGSKKAGDALAVGEEQANNMGGKWDGDKLEAARKAARDTADGFATQMPDQAMGTYTQIEQNRPAAEQSLHDLARSTRDNLDLVYTSSKQSLDAIKASSIQAAGTAKTAAIAQIDQACSSTTAALGAQGAAQVAAIHQQGKAARGQITSGGAAARAAAAQAGEQAASGLEGGAAGIVRGAADIEVPDLDEAARKVGKSAADLEQGADGITKGLSATATGASESLTHQASGAAGGMASLAQSAKAEATQTGAGARQQITMIAHGAIEALGQIADAGKTSTDKTTTASQTSFTEQVTNLTTAYTNTATDRATTFKGNLAQCESSLDGTVPSKNGGKGGAGSGKKADGGGDSGGGPTGEVQAIQDAAQKAADAVKPWWQKALAIVVSVVVAIAVVVIVTALIATTGPVGVILVGALAGALSTVAGTMASNLVLGNSLMEGVTWKSVLIGAVGGALCAGATVGVGAAAKAVAGSALTEGTGAAARGISVAAKALDTSEGVAGGFQAASIRYGTNLVTNFAGNELATFAVDHKLDLSLQTIMLTIALNKMPGKLEHFQAKVQSKIQSKIPFGFQVKKTTFGNPAKVGGSPAAGGDAAAGSTVAAGTHDAAPAHPGGAAPSTAKPSTTPSRSPSTPTAGAEPTVAPSAGSAPSPTPHGNAGPASHDGATPHGDPAPAPHGDPAPAPHGDPAPAPHGDPAPAPHGGTDPAKAPQGGADPARPAHGNDAGTPAHPGDAADPAKAHGDADPANPHGDADPAGSHGDADPGTTHSDGGAEPAKTTQGTAANDAAGPHPGDHAPAGAAHGTAGDAAGAHGDAAPAKAPGDAGGDASAPHISDGGAEPTPEAAQAAAHDAQLDELGYPAGTHAKGDELAGKIESGAKPAKDSLRDTEANQRGARDLEQILRDPTLTPADKVKLQHELAARLRAEPEPTGNLARDIQDVHAQADKTGPAHGGDHAPGSGDHAPGDHAPGTHDAPGARDHSPGHGATEITAAKVTEPSSTFTGKPKGATAHPELNVAEGTEALHALAERQGMTVEPVGDPKLSKFRITTADGESFTVTIKSEGLKGDEVARTTVDPKTDEHTIRISSKADPANVERAMAHELAELQDIRARHADGGSTRARDALAPGDRAPTQLSPHDRGRLAELDVLRRQHDAAVAAHDPAKAAEARREIQALVDHLGLRGGSAGADARLQLIEDQGNLPRETRALLEASSHPGIEVHNHLLGIADTRYFIDKVGGGEPRALFEKIDEIFTRRTTDAELKRARELETESPLTKQVVETTRAKLAEMEAAGATKAETDAFLMEQLDKILAASKETPFDQSYSIRDELIKEYIDPPSKGGYVNITADSIKALASDGIRYSEQSVSVNKLNKVLSPDDMAAAHQQAAAAGADSDVRFLAMTNTKGLTTEAPVEPPPGSSPAEMQAYNDRKAAYEAESQQALAQIDDVLKRGDVMGIDIAGPEQGTFTADGVKRFLDMYDHISTAAKARGRELVLRPHVGEGYAGPGVPHADVARENLEMLLDGLEAKGYSPAKAKADGVIIRFGHATHATPEQIARMKELGIIAEANIGSNLATGSIDSRDAHPLLYNLLLDEPTILSTDAHGVMSTNLTKEYETAAEMIKEFRDGQTTITIDGVEKRFADLTADQQARFDIAKLKQWAAEYGDRVAAGDTTDTARHASGATDPAGKPGTATPGPDAAPGGAQHTGGARDITAAAVPEPGSTFTGRPDGARSHPRTNVTEGTRALKRLAKQQGMKVEGAGADDRFRVTTADGETFEVTIKSEALDGDEVANTRVDPTTDEHIIRISDKADPANVSRAMAHELAELQDIRARHADGRSTDAQDALAAGTAAPTELSPHDRGRLAELDVLRRQREAAVESGDRARLTAANREIQALVDHLGLRDDTPGAEARRQLIEDHGNVPPETRALLDDLRRPNDLLTPEDRGLTPGNGKLTLGTGKAQRVIDLDHVEALAAEVHARKDARVEAALDKLLTGDPRLDIADPTLRAEARDKAGNEAVRDAVLVQFRNNEHFNDATGLTDLLARVAERLERIEQVSKLDWDADVTDIAAAHPEREQFFRALEGLAPPAKVKELWSRVVEGVHAQKAINDSGMKIPNKSYFDLAEEMSALLAIKPGEVPALWSGGYDVSMFAQNKGFRTLEATEAGRLFDQLKLFKDFSTLGPLWDAISTKFVASFAGETHVFVRSMDKSGTLFREELAALVTLDGVTAIKWHVMKGGDLSSLVEVDAAGNPAPGHTFDGFRAAAAAMEADAFRAPGGPGAIGREPTTPEAVRDKMIAEQKQIPHYVDQLRTFVDDQAATLGIDRDTFKGELDHLKDIAELQLKNNPAVGVDLADLYAEIRRGLAKDLDNLADDATATGAAT